MYLVKTPKFIKKLFPNLIWDRSDNSEAVYLTFDDGPIPEVTPWVLNLLDQHQIKASFFCIAKNVEAHPKIYSAILKAGHTVGNHSYSHLSGWQSSTQDYEDDISKAKTFIDSNLFRPPYGRISKRQIKKLIRTYDIIMWDVLSADFDESISEEQCYLNVVNNVEPGSIIVFHDSLKAKKRLMFTLPKVINYLSAQGFVFDVL